MRFWNCLMLFSCKGFHPFLWLERGAFRNWFPVYGGVGIPKMDWWNWVADENVDEGFLGNASFLFLVALFSAWGIFLEPWESLPNSSGLYSSTVIQPPADLSASLINLLRFCISLIISSIFLVNLRTGSISCRNFASSSFTSCSRLSSYWSLFPLFRNDIFTFFFSFCFRVCSSLWFFQFLIFCDCHNIWIKLFVSSMVVEVIGTNFRLLLFFYKKILQA